MQPHRNCKGQIIAARTLAIALLTIAIAVNSTWAASDQPSWLPFTPISTDMAAQPDHARLGIRHFRLFAQDASAACRDFAYRRYSHCLADAYDIADQDPHGTDRLYAEKVKCQQQYMQDQRNCG